MVSARVTKRYFVQLVGRQLEGLVAKRQENIPLDTCVVLNSAGRVLTPHLAKGMPRAL